MGLTLAWWYNWGSPDNTLRIVSKGALQDLCKGAQKGAPEVALKGCKVNRFTLLLKLLFKRHKQFKDTINPLQLFVEKCLLSPNQNKLKEIWDTVL